MGKLIAPVVEPGALSMTTQPTIGIDHELSLRPFNPLDCEAVVVAFSTADIQHFHFRRFDTDEGALRWIEDCRNGWRTDKAATWATVEVASGKVCGRVTIYLSLQDGHGEVSYWVLPFARGRGVATRSCVAATRWAHDLGIHRIELQHSTQNEASRRVAQQAGFTAEGVRREANLHDDGWHDMVVNSHLSTDPWPEHV